MSYFAIKRLDCGLYWTGKTWGPLNKAKEWAKQSVALQHAKKIAETLPGVYVAITQPV